MKKRLIKAVTALTLGSLLALGPVGCIKKGESDIKQGYTQLTSFEKHGFFEIESFSLSPDKKRISFSAEKYGPRLNWNEDSEIYVMDVDGSNLKKLTDNRDSDYNPVWSKDGKKIFFDSSEDDSRKLKAVSIEDKSLEEIIKVENHEYIGGMSPDESSLLFYKRNEQIKEQPFELHKLNIKSGTTEKVAEGVGDAEWSPDGKKLVYIKYAGKDNKLCILDLATKEETILREGAYFSSPKWSPDSKKVAYFAYEPYNHSNSLMMLEFVDEKKDRALDRVLRSYAGTELEERKLRWSPDSKRLLFATFTKNSQEAYTCYIDTLYSSQNIKCEQITYSLGSESSPDWLNGKEIIALYFDPEKFEDSQIYRINPEKTVKDKRSMFDILEPGIPSSDIGGIIEKISPEGFKSYKSMIDARKRDPNFKNYSDWKLLYESVTLAEDGEKMIIHRVLKEKDDIYRTEYCIFERWEDPQLRPGSYGAYSFRLKEDSYSDGQNEYYINGKAEKKILSDFFKMEKKDKDWEIKGYGRGGTTYYKTYN